MNREAPERRRAAWQGSPFKSQAHHANGRNKTIRSVPKGRDGQHGYSTPDQPSNIPQELKALPRWAPWRYVHRMDGKKPDKVAFRTTGGLARTNTPEDWGPFEAARAAYQRGRFDGLGFLIFEGDPFVGFDFDDCLDPETGEIHPAVAGLMEGLDGYAEISPSGTGMKVIARGRKPGKRCVTRKTPWGGEFAVYDHKRFFTLTGRAIGDRREIAVSQEAVEEAYRWAFGEESLEKPARKVHAGDVLADDELVEKALRSKKGGRFRRHHLEGDASGYPSRSEADHAHLADLCFWTGGDEERMVELFTRSALYLPEKGLGYVRRSARKAIRTHDGGYYQKPKERPRAVLDLVGVIERAWWGERFPGMAGKTDASVLRALIREGKRIGEAVTEVGLRVSISVRQLAEAANCHYNTVINATRRAAEAGILRREKGAEGLSGAFVLLDPRQVCDTHKDTGGCVLGGVTNESRPPVADLTTEHYAWRSAVGKGRERALCALEAFGPLRVEELAERLGWSRPRDLRKRYLEPLVALGLVEDRGDGTYALAGDYRERQEEVSELVYGTFQKRLRRVYDPRTKRTTTTVVESGMVASGIEHRRLRRDKHRLQQEAYRLRLEERRRSAEGDERGIEALLNRMDDERDAASHRTVNRPEIVDGVIVHGAECSCSFCEDLSTDRSPMGEEVPA